MNDYREMLSAVATVEHGDSRNSAAALANKVKNIKAEIGRAKVWGYSAATAALIAFRAEFGTSKKEAGRFRSEFVEILGGDKFRHVAKRYLDGATRIVKLGAMPAGKHADGVEPIKACEGDVAKIYSNLTRRGYLTELQLRKGIGAVKSEGVTVDKVMDGFAKLDPADKFKVLALVREALSDRPAQADNVTVLPVAAE